MSIENSNQGPGWGDHNTPYGQIHSYDGNTGSSSYGGTTGGNGHGGVSDTTNINITSSSYDGTLMSMCVNNLKKHEGFKNNMYKDSLGNITIGIGHLLANAEMAAALPFTTSRSVHGHGDDLSSQVSVSKDDVRSIYNSYKAGLRPAPGWTISNDTVIGMCIKDVQTTEVGLRGIYSGYDGFSNSRKVALVDMGFNIGIPKLTKEFPNFNAAVNRGDWASAAVESHRTGLDDSRNPRNKDTHDQLLK